MATFFTSDTHYFHKNIAGPKISQWDKGYRDFEDEKEMSRHLVKVFNQTLKHDDILYHLGDWSFGGIQNIWNFRKQINCENIHLILGNHDHHIKEDKSLEVPQADKDDCFHRFGGYADVPARNLFSSVNDVLDLKIGKTNFFLSHYKHAIWQASHKGTIHLYGHSHSSAEYWKIGKSMDVGVDNAKRLLGEYKPFRLEEIIQIMDKIPTDFKDHHTKDTNK